MYFRSFLIISPWKRARPFIWIPLTQECIVPSLVEINPVILENKIFQVCQCIFAISLLSPIAKRRGPSFKQIWIHITQECFVPSFVEIGPVVLKKKKFVSILSLFRYYLPLAKGGPFIQTNMNFHHPSKFGWNWSSGSEENFQSSSIYYRYFVITLYLPLEKGVALHLHKRESPSSKAALCQVWLNLAH